MKNDLVNSFAAINAKELYEMQLPENKQVIEGLLFQGVTILAGSGKIGKSFAVLHICMCVANGTQIWGRKTLKGTTLYLALEDNLTRIQGRLDKVIDGTGIELSENMYIATMSKSIKGGLEEQIQSFMGSYPETILIVVDTFQKVRTTNNERNANIYALDYEEMGILKVLADRYNIAILLIHHLRKAGDGDEFNKISGSTGISGAADNLMLLAKEKRLDNTASLQLTGRESADIKLVLEFDRVKCIWSLVSEESDKYLYDNEAAENTTVKALLKFMEDKMVWESSPLELLTELKKSESKIPDVPNVLTRRINHYRDYLLEQGIEVTSCAGNGKRIITITNHHT